jgi:hypothetical protein
MYFSPGFPLLPPSLAQLSSPVPFTRTLSTYIIPSICETKLYTHMKQHFPTIFQFYVFIHKFTKNLRQGRTETFHNSCSLA